MIFIILDWAEKKNTFALNIFNFITFHFEELFGGMYSLEFLNLSNQKNQLYFFEYYCLI